MEIGFAPQMLTINEYGEHAYVLGVTLDGYAQPGDVLSGKTFFNSSSAKQTRTLALTGTAAEVDVAIGKTFYNINTTLKTGMSTSTPGSPDASNGPVRRAIIVAKEVPSPVEKLSLELYEVLIEEKVDRKKRVLQGLQKIQQQPS